MFDVNQVILTLYFCLLFTKDVDKMIFLTLPGIYRTSTTCVLIFRYKFKNFKKKEIDNKKNFFKM